MVLLRRKDMITKYQYPLHQRYVNSDATVGPNYLSHNPSHRVTRSLGTDGDCGRATVPESHPEHSRTAALLGTRASTPLSIGLSRIYLPRNTPEATDNGQGLDSKRA